jgi:hypothetical protein
VLLLPELLRQARLRVLNKITGSVNETVGAAKKQMKNGVRENGASEKNANDGDN